MSTIYLPRGALAALTIGFLGSTAAHAQDRPTPPPTASQRADDPFVGISYSVDVSDEDSEASVSVSGYFARPMPSGDGTAAARTDISWKVGVEIPVGGSDNVLDRATLDKLGDGTKLSASLNFLHFQNDPSRLGSPDFLELMRVAAEECRKNAKTEAELTACTPVGPSESYILKHTLWARLAMNRALYSGYWSAGMKGAVSLKRYNWVDQGTLAENKASPSGYSATVWGVYYPSDAVSAWKLEGEYSSALDQADPEVICKTVIVTPKDDCVKAAPSGPVRKDALVIRGEYRRYVPFRSGKGGIGAAITGSVDTLTGDYGIELPVYLTIPGVEAVTPGVKVGYSSKEDDVTVALFIKTSFSF